MGSVAKDQTLTLGMISCTVRVESALYTEDFLTNVCVNNHEPQAVKRPLTCETCGPINMMGLRKAKKEGGGLVVLEEAEVAGLAEDATPYKAKIQLIPYDTQEVLSNTAEGEKLYYLTPQTSPENLSLIKQVVAAYPNKMFVARYTVRTKASLFVAQIKGDCLLLSERVFQDRLKPLPTYTVPANEAFVGLAVAMVETMNSEFTPETFSDSYTRNLVEITRERPVIGGKVATTAPQDPKITADLVRLALAEYRIRKGAEISADVEV